MKAMRAHQFGGPEQLRFEDAPDPQVQAGQVQIRGRAAGINPADLVRLSGRLQGQAVETVECVGGHARQGAPRPREASGD